MRFLLGKLFLTWALGEAGGSVSACAGDSAVGLWQSLKLGAVNCDFLFSACNSVESSLLDYVSIETSEKYFLCSFVTLFIKDFLLA